MYGYRGRVLFVDLFRRTVRSEALDPALLQEYIGGVGLGARLLYSCAPRGVDPLSPEAPLILTGSPLAGVGIPSTSKFAVACKSPLTDFIGDSLSSGPVADELRRMPFDALVITGKAPNLTCLVLQDDRVAFREIQYLAGCAASETERQVKALLKDPEMRVVAIGPAGEALVLYACITNDGRQAGRTGSGAVMGSKNLKAIAFRGTGSCLVARPRELAIVAGELRKKSEGEATAKYRGPGTVANLTRLNQMAALPSYNFRRSSFEGAHRLSAERLQEEHGRASGGGDASRDWEHFYKTKGENVPAVRSRVEYESLFALGPLCGIDDPDIVIQASALCDRIGVDTISTGGTIAWAMECYERGLLSTTDTDGLELRFGNGKALLSAIEKIGRREGIGDLLAQGSRQAAQTLGCGSQAWAMQVKGLEMPGYDPRTLKTLALGLAVNPRGACHNRSSAYDADMAPGDSDITSGPDRGVAAAASEDFAAVLDSLILSKFLRRCFTDFYGETAHMYELITGWETSPEELRRVGERINNLRKAFNLREGWTRTDDALPPRIFEDSALSSDELEGMIDGYYRARGWTPEGLIPGARLTELGLDGLVADADIVPITAQKR
ncbi:MAG: aldehyde ferredoxin oxidoreductase family protein [Chloroflexi bacterium]|nr:aldehyde ferredoxin oxidoreductase family protein [Chloroflexota bacterium]